VQDTINMTIEINSGNDWLAGIDNEDYFVKFVGMPDDIATAKNYIKYRTFNDLREFSECIRANFKFASCVGMVSDS